MSFDEVTFPLKIPNGASAGPEFSTEVVVLASGAERRNQNWSQARRRFDARTGLRSASDSAVLLAFFMARAGRARGFRLRDWSDYSSAADGVSVAAVGDQIIAIGDGVTTIFPLVKNYGSGTFLHRRIITKPIVDSVRISVGGMELVSGWSVDSTTGTVTFAVPPALGQAITAGYLFDVPVRFDTDSLNLIGSDDKTTRATIPVVEIRIQ